MIGDCDLVNSCKFALGVLVKRFGNVREFLKKLHFLELFFKDRSESSYFQLSEFFCVWIFSQALLGRSAMEAFANIWCSAGCLE